MVTLPFTKMHGIGNDYVYIDAFAHSVPDPSRLTQRISPRHTGIGSDGLILIRPSTVADCRMEMYNADGSRAEMCGNGLRCLAKYAYDHNLARRNPMRVETDGGVKLVQLAVRNGRVSEVTVDMDKPILDGPRIPVASDGRIIGAPLGVDATTYEITCLSMGNPHCVVFVPRVAPVDLEQLGPRFERHPFFPRRVNTEFVQVDSPADLTMRVWERGSGETAACGSGACAALVAAVLTRRANRRVTVHLRGGDLAIEWRAEDDHVYMTGPAEEVFRGEIEVEQ